MDVYLLLRKFINKYICKIYNPVNKIYFKLNRVQYGHALNTKGRVYILRHYGTAQITIGDHVSINSAGWANPIGCGEKTYFQVLDNAQISIGDYSGISNAALTCAERIDIGSHVLIGAGCKIYDTDFHSLDYSERVKGNYKGAPVKSAPIIIEDGVFVGAGSYILKGVHIGMHSIIGAGSVVTKDVPPYEMWGGNPAQFIKKIEENANMEQE